MKGTAGPASAHDSVRNTLDTDGMLAEWGARLFYPIPKGKGDSGGGKLPLAAIAATMTPVEVRSRIRSTVAPGATQVMVKITGGGRGMKAIAAHFRYIGRLGKDEAGGKGQTLEIEDKRGEKIQGSVGLAQLTDEWRVAGAYIDDTSSRREAFTKIRVPPMCTCRFAPTDTTVCAWRHARQTSIVGARCLRVACRTAASMRRPPASPSGSPIATTASCGRTEQSAAVH